MSSESCDRNFHISPNKFCFYQSNVNRMDSFNTIFKKHRESTTNEASNTKQNVNQNLDIEGLIYLRKLCINNLIISYLNINMLKNKTTRIREICRNVAIDMLCIDEIKLDASFSDAQFHIEDCPPFRQKKTVTKKNVLLT